MSEQSTTACDRHREGVFIPLRRWILVQLIIAFLLAVVAGQIAAGWRYLPAHDATAFVVTVTAVATLALGVIRLFHRRDE